MDVEKLELAQARLAQIKDLAEAQGSIDLGPRAQPLKVHHERGTHGVRAALDALLLGAAAHARLHQPTVTTPDEPVKFSE